MTLVYICQNIITSFCDTMLYTKIFSVIHSEETLSRRECSLSLSYHMVVAD